MTFNQALLSDRLDVVFSSHNYRQETPCSSYFLLKPNQCRDINVKHSGHREGQEEGQGLCGQGFGIQVCISNLFLPFDYFS